MTTPFARRLAFAVVFSAFLGGCGSGEQGSTMAGSSGAPTDDRAEPDWSSAARLPEEGHRANPFGLAPREHQAAIETGRLHALLYPPTEVTGILFPYQPFERMLTGEDRTVLQAVVGEAAERFTGFHSLDDLFAWLGLHPYPDESAEGIYRMPYPDGVRPDYRMGVTLVDGPNGMALTFGCATCHVGRLFGRAVFGLTNRFPRANETFVLAKRSLPLVNPLLFRTVAGASRGEGRQLARSRHSLRSVGARKPRALGLDTSLAHVSLSLARRELDDVASRSAISARFPRHNLLAHHVADSKPAVWWNLKYKTRWLSDGSVVSGNPILTNLLWNEIGRGTDLEELADWLRRNEDVIEELTTAVFAVEAPRYTDFFPASAIDLAEAKRGETVFNQTCARCHGRYEKAWSRPGAEHLDPIARLATTRVHYHERTPVIDVGTDPGRYQGMTAFAERLNDLAISREWSMHVVPQRGYVPPPLVGIWARWPYFHNNSVPSLCALLTRATERPRVYYSGEPIDQERDFDQECNGYPQGDDTPQRWRVSEHRFDTTVAGLSNDGHDEGIFIKDGKELLTPEDKRALITYLKTL